MSKLQDLYKKNIDREIQGVIKVDDEGSIQQELDEYVVTDEILKHFRLFFSSYNTSIDQRTEKNGVWISGFFGSGKSHFLKILSYILDNREVGGKKAVDYFDDKIGDPMLLADMKRASGVPADVILFNIDSKAAQNANDSKDRILSVFEKVFNEKLGLSTIPHVAELERFLQKNNQYEAFKTSVKEISGKDWSDIREDFYFEQDTIVKAYKEVTGHSEEEARNWVEKSEENYHPSIEDFAKRVREYIESCGDNRHVLFLIDEVGQYINGEDSAGALLNLQTMVEDLGTECGGKAWICCTGQAAIDDVVKVGNADEFSKIQGRFATRISLSSANVDEVIKRRILDKTDDARQMLEAVYEKDSAVLKNLFTWNNASTQKFYLDSVDFANTYPFVPYQFNLLQNVFTDIRKSGFAGKHLSSGERSLLGAFQRTAQRFKDAETGTIIPFYAFFDTVEEFLEGPITRVFTNARQLEKMGTLKQLDIDILKTLFMLRNLESIPTNIENVTIFSANKIDTDILSLKNEVSESLKRLEKETLIQRIDNNYRFLTDDEQEINRKIKGVNVDQARITEKLKTLIYDEILTSNKIKFHESVLPVAQYLDDNRISAREQEINIRIATSYGDKKEDDIKNESLGSPNSIYAFVEFEGIHADELMNCLKIDEYKRNTFGVKNNEQVDKILHAKEQEARDIESRVREYLSEVLGGIDYYIAGEKVILSSHEPNKRAEEALNILATDVYSKIGYIEQNYNISDVRQLFHTDAKQMPENNQRAYDDIYNYLCQKNDQSIPVTIQDLISRFNKPPYGYRDEDVLWLITKLLKNEAVNLIYANQNQSPVAEETLNKLTSRSYYGNTIIKLRTKISQDLVSTVKNLAIKSLGKSLPDNEDGIMQGFIEAANDWQKRIAEYLLNYPNGEKYPYPGKNILEQTKDQLSSLSSIRDTAEFFERVANEAKAIESNMEAVNNISSFLSINSKQKPIFDSARKTIEIYDRSQKYVANADKLNNIASQMIEILTLAEPYSRVPELVDLRTELNNELSSVYEDIKKPALESINKAIEYIDMSTKEAGLDPSFGDSYKNSLNGIAEDISHPENFDLERASAKKTLINNIRDRFDTALENEKNRKTTGESGDKSPKPTVQRKTVRAFELINKPYQINSEADIDSYLSELKSKLVLELKENKNLTIK